MGRLFFWLIVGILFWVAARLLLRSGGSAGKPGSTGRQAGGSEQMPMLQCAYCGVHFPAAEAVRAEDGRVFCTPRHDQLAHHPDSA